MSPQRPAQFRALEILEPRRLMAGGALDPSFGAGSVVTTGFAVGTSVLNDLAVYPDGSILAGGYVVPQGAGVPSDVPQMGLAKYRFDGTLDPAFGIGGQIVATPRGIKAALDLAMLDDGSFVVIGSSASGYSTRANLMLKFTPDGRVDTSFGSNGKVSLPMSAAAMTVGSDGWIYVAGQSDRDGAIARYSARGGLDTDFGDDGTFTTSSAFVEEPDTTFVFDSIAVDSIGRVIAGGTRRDSGTSTDPTTRFDVRVVRLMSDGQLDTDFGGESGFFSATRDFPFTLPEGGASVGAVVVGADDNAVVAVTPHEQQVPYVCKLSASGRLNTAFSQDGVAALSIKLGRFPLNGSLVEQVDGKILFAGSIERSGRNVFSVQRLDAAGEPDATYGQDGIATVTFKKIAGEARVAALAPDGSIVAGGIVGSVQPGGVNDSRRFALSRLFREEGPAGQLIPKTLRQSQAGFLFDVIWRDDDLVDLSTVDGGDLRVFGSDQIARRAKLSSATVSLDGRMVVARYRLPALDGGVFTPADNGQYLVKVLGNQVFDDADNPASKRSLGSIRVRIV